MWNDSRNDYGNNSTTGGTGFFTDANNVNSPQSKAKASRRLQSVVPLCIRQLRDHPEEEFKLFGLPTQLITIMGILKEYEVQSTKASYKIEDHTGSIKAIWWLENGDSASPNLPMVKEGCYVRTYGSMRVQDGEKLLMVMKMYPVENVNEITTHLLEVIFTRLQAEALNKDGPPISLKKNNPGAELANSMSFMYNDVEMSSTSKGFTNIQDKVYRLLQPDTSKLGLHRSQILQQFPTHQHREVEAALEFLINEGHAYSTLDNDYFKATDSM